MSGRHIKVLGRGNPEMLSSERAVRGFLESVVRRVGMRPLGEAITYEVEQTIEKMGAEPFEDEGGVTGILVLSTSHCAIHTWPLRMQEGREMFVLDLYSCRTFETEPVLELLRLCFETSRVKVNDFSASLVYS